MKKTIKNHIASKSSATRSGVDRAPRLALQREVIRELSSEYLTDVAGRGSTQVVTCSTFTCKEN